MWIFNSLLLIVLVGNLAFSVDRYYKYKRSYLYHGGEGSATRYRRAGRVMSLSTLFVFVGYPAFLLALGVF